MTDCSNTLIASVLETPVSCQLEKKSEKSQKIPETHDDRVMQTIKRAQAEFDSMNDSEKVECLIAEF
jgi:hypothetical protein